VADVVLTGIEGHKLSLRSARSADAEQMWSYLATLSVPSGEVTSEVWEHRHGLGQFLRGLAESWRGFDGDFWGHRMTDERDR
jgi:sarcosine oxidase delta subunit